MCRDTHTDKDTDRQTDRQTDSLKHYLLRAAQLACNNQGEIHCSTQLCRQSWTHASFEVSRERSNCVSCTQTSTLDASKRVVLRSHLTCTHRAVACCEIASFVFVARCTRDLNHFVPSRYVPTLWTSCSCFRDSASPLCREPDYKDSVSLCLHSVIGRPLGQL